MSQRLKAKRKRSNNAKGIKIKSSSSPQTRKLNGKNVAYVKRKKK